MSVPSPSTYFSKIYFFNFYILFSNPHIEYLRDVSRLFSQPAESYKNRLSHTGVNRGKKAGKGSQGHPAGLPFLPHSANFTSLAIPFLIQPLPLTNSHLPLISPPLSLPDAPQSQAKGCGIHRRAWPYPYEGIKNQLLLREEQSLSILFILPLSRSCSLWR